MVCDKMVCERECVKDGVWQSCVCESCVWIWCVKDGGWQSCVWKLCVKDGVWQSCVVCDRRAAGGRGGPGVSNKLVWQRGCARWRLPRRTQVPVTKCHACHAKRRWMWQSATLATQNECRSRQVPRLPRKVPRRHRRLKPTQSHHPVP